MAKMEKIQNQIQTLDHQIDMMIAYYFLDEESHPLQSIELAVDTLIYHPDLYEHIPASSLDLLLTDMKQVKGLLRLMIDRGELKKKLFRL